MQIAGTRLPFWLVIGYALSLLSLAAWPCLAPTSLMAFDDPAAHKTLAPYVYVACMCLYPIVPLAGVPASFLAFKTNRRGLAYLLFGFALLPMAALVIWFLALAVILIWRP